MAQDKKDKKIVSSNEDNQKSAIVRREEEVLEFWQKNQIFQKSQIKESPKGEFTFFDGPPFATGLPHYGHVLPGTIKDVIPRYKTMQGYHVPRVWGWDCHGLPIENLIEKELGFSTKKDIETYGIDKFNQAARAAVLRYDAEWKKIIPRLGRWVDMDNAYKTMDTSYSESIWWSFKELYDKGLIYNGFKAMHLCPHCETTLANFEVAQNYKDITDISVYIKFELVDEPGTYLLAWTTTPWTLPGNTAVAVHPETDYVQVKTATGSYILAKDRFEVLKDKFEDPQNLQIVKEFKGTELVGRSYKPIFDYYTDTKTVIKDKENIWKVWPAEYVTTDTGTGIVHLAPAFGEEDLLLAQEHHFPIIHHVRVDGTFAPEVTDFAGHKVKPKDTAENSNEHQKSDIDIIKKLAHDGHLFAKEKIIHAYPHCWRCDTPLLNYAASSWFVQVTKFKDKLLATNADVSWVPKEIGENRFGKWLEGARDWAISRSRYWGAPLPVWQCEKCKSTTVIGSVKELASKTAHTENTYFLMRHGQADNNIAQVLSGNPETQHHLTEKGRVDVARAALELKVEGIDTIFASPLVRTRETAEIVAEALGIPVSGIIFDDRLKEVNTGDLDGQAISEYHTFYSSTEEKFIKPTPNGETLTELKTRVSDFLYDINTRYNDRKILIVTHEYPVWLMSAGAHGATQAQTVGMRDDSDFIAPGEFHKLEFVPLPHNENFELDVHRPYIDEIALPCSCGGLSVRIPEVFDTWYESGSMPYAQSHYPFEHKDVFNPDKHVGFPANFIAEGVDQTRGWFYSLIVLGVALFGESPYQNVVVNGIVLAEDGQKMSKRLKNYPDLMEVVEKYGADSLRYYLMASPGVRADDLRFSEQGVDEVSKKIIMRLSNVHAFYALYAPPTLPVERQQELPQSEHVLDIWILARLAELISEVTARMEVYEIDAAVRPVGLFVDDLSTWYLRRSRDRFKGANSELEVDDADKQAAISTTYFVLRELAKLLAPFMPFYSEYLYQALVQGQLCESVHLESWPKVPHVKGVGDVIKVMEKVRHIVSVGLEARAKSGIKVRQPLADIRIKNQGIESREDVLELIRDELNVKNVIFDFTQADELVLNTVISEDLKKEGMVRDLVRHVQELRKDGGLEPSERVILKIATADANKGFVYLHEDAIKHGASLLNIVFDAMLDAPEVSVDTMKFKLAVER